MAENDTSPERQAYLGVEKEGYTGRLATNIANIRLFKDNPYIRDLSKADRIELNKELIEPKNGEQFYDDDKYVWICKHEKDPVTNELVYSYYSKMKDLANEVEYFKSKGVFNQILSAYNNGQVYKFYFDRTINMMFPNTSIVFPEEFNSYTVRKQQLNENKAYVYVAGVAGDDVVLDTRIGMKVINDTNTNSKYTRMSPASIFPTSNPDKQYDQVVNGEFYVVDFYNIDGIIIDSKLFQAVESVAVNTAIPSVSVVDLELGILRNSIPEKSANNIYPILSGEDLTKTISFTVKAIYSDGSVKLITDKLDTAQLTREGWDVDTTGAEIGKQFTVKFTYWPTINEDGEPIGSPITREVVFQVVANNYEKLYKVLPIVWSGNTSDFQIDSSETRTYYLKVYTLSNDGILENRTRAAYSTLKKVDVSDSNKGLIDFTDCPYTYDPYNGVITFVFPSSATTGDTDLSFSIYDNSVLSECRIKVQFGKDAQTTVGRFVKPTGDQFSYGYDPTSGLLRTLADTFEKNNSAILGMSSSNGYAFQITCTDNTFYNKYMRIIDGSKTYPNRVQLFIVKDNSNTPISEPFQLSRNAESIVIPTYVDANITTLVRNINNYDYILAKFSYVETGSQEVTDIDTFCVNKTSQYLTN